MIFVAAGNRFDVGIINFSLVGLKAFRDYSSISLVLSPLATGNRPRHNSRCRVNFAAEHTRALAGHFNQIRLTRDFAANSMPS